MPRAVPKADAVSRDEAIELLRKALLGITDIETSACKAAGDRGIFCRGFSALSDEELRRRYDWIVRRDPKISRAHLEELANAWQLAQQEVKALPCACDVQTKAHDTCRGWHDFTNEQLSKFIQQFTGRTVAVA